MSFSHRVHPQAREDITNGYSWYEDMQSGLGERFLQTVKDRIEDILLHPEWFGSKKKGYRETIVSKDFPFLIVYKIDFAKKEILISSVFHSKRDHKNKYRA